MEKKQQSKKTTTEKEKGLPKGYYIVMNGKFISDGRDPFTLKEAITVFNTIKTIVLEEDKKACVGYSSIVSDKMIIEIVDSEFLDARLRETPVEDSPSIPYSPAIPVPPPIMPTTPVNPITPSFPGVPTNPFMPVSPSPSPMPMGPNPFVPSCGNPFMDPPSGYYEKLFKCETSPASTKPPTKEEKEKKASDFFKRFGPDEDKPEKKPEKD